MKCEDKENNYMIKNIVFDFGGVVLTWDPKIILKNFTKNESYI